MLDLTTKTSAELVELLRTIPVSEWNVAVKEAQKKKRDWVANLRSANLRSANLRSANLSSADLSNANLRYANLRSAKLRSADLRSANLRSANLRSADLRFAGLRYATLCDADLSYAKLSDANLSDANLRDANLRSVNLYCANLRFADLRSASLHFANLHQVHNNGTQLTIDQWCDIFEMPTTSEGLRVGFKRLPADRITGRSQNNGKHLIEWKPNQWVEAPDWNDRDKCGGGLHISPTAAMTLTHKEEPLLIVAAFDPDDAVCLGDKLKVRRCKVL